MILRGCSSAFSFVIMMTSYAGRAHGRYKSAGERTVAEGFRQLGLVDRCTHAPEGTLLAEELDDLEYSGTCGAAGQSDGHARLFS